MKIRLLWKKNIMQKFAMAMASLAMTGCHWMLCIFRPCRKTPPFLAANECDATITPMRNHSNGNARIYKPF